jgi:hypothetical protein
MLFWHASPVIIKGLGPMGCWVIHNGTTELAQRTCLSDQPSDPGECDKCGWQLNAIKLNDWEEIWRYVKCKP